MIHLVQGVIIILELFIFTGLIKKLLFQLLMLRIELCVQLLELIELSEVAMGAQRRAASDFNLVELVIVLEHLEVYIIEQMVQSVDADGYIPDLFVHSCINKVLILQIKTRLRQLVHSHAHLVHTFPHLFVGCLELRRILQH